MPQWIQQILIGLGGIVGGRMIGSVSERMKEGRELRHSVDKLTLVVQVQLSALQDEIKSVGGRNEEQLKALRGELHEHKMEQERRFSGLEERLDATVERVNRVPAPTPAWSPEPRVHSNLRVDREGRCLRPEFGTDGKDEAAGNHGGGHG